MRYLISVLIAIGNPPIDFLLFASHFSDLFRKKCFDLFEMATVDFDIQNFFGLIRAKANSNNSFSVECRY